MSQELQKPVVGFSCGDINGIGIELIIKSLADNRITDLCVPVIFSSNKCVNFYRMQDTAEAMSVSQVRPH